MFRESCLYRCGLFAYTIADSFSNKRSSRGASRLVIGVHNFWLKLVLSNEKTQLVVDISNTIVVWYHTICYDMVLYQQVGNMPPFKRPQLLRCRVWCIGHFQLHQMISLFRGYYEKWTICYIEEIDFFASWRIGKFYNQGSCRFCLNYNCITIGFYNYCID